MALSAIAERAAGLDREPRFPAENIADLRAAGVLEGAPGGAARSLAEQIALVRSVAYVDASTARILDGHLNAIERISVSGLSELRETELEAVAEGRLLLGVWGADPVPDEGLPARVVRRPDGALVLEGVKTFCSGAGGVQRALVVVDGERGGRRLAYVDAGAGLEIDRGWYRACGLRASESHRVEFDGTPVLALLGGENELLREPYFARDGVRTASTWAGIADGVFDATCAALGGRPSDDLRAHAVGSMGVALATIDRWLAHAADRLEASLPADEPGLLAIECRAAIADCARTVATLAGQAAGARALVTGGKLDRCRRDLDLFLLQHRIDPQLVRVGRATLDT
jgi:alkylation response protein AidB-like acyl-CoA dehydrogenase